MAKVKSMGLRNYQGQLGGAVYYNLNGQNVARELAPSVSNPRTRAQMVQRAKLKNAVSFFKANAPWMNNAAFESKKQEWSTYNAFVSANQNIAAAYLTKADTAAGGGLVLPYIVTAGSLPSVAVEISEGEFATNIYIGNDFGFGGQSAAAVSRELLRYNERLAEGDQISFIVEVQRIGADGTPYVECNPYEFIIDTTDTRNFESLPMGAFVSSLGVDGQDFSRLSFEPALDTNLYACTIVVSRGKTGAVKVSSQQLVPSSYLMDFIADYRTQRAYDAYADSYGDSRSEDWLAEGYQGDVTISQPDYAIISLDGIPAGSDYPLGGNNQFANAVLAWNQPISSNNVDELEIGLYARKSSGEEHRPSLTASSINSSSGTGRWNVTFPAIPTQEYGEWQEWHVEYVRCEFSDGHVYRADYAIGHYGTGDDGDVTD